ncbi:MAG TPA: sigma factor-like helix-turn-helix DNA-binding protein [Streptosporangiaceae bacterium]|nr:sigma factor-like helix-turn-helix DNA-binding protein [Streptosporangiaceae bacterium]
MSARLETLRRQSDQTVCATYEAHYRALTQLAALLVGDLEAGEDIAQAAFIAVHRAGRLLDAGDTALLYLRREVVRRARSRPAARRRASAQTAQPKTPGSPEAARAQAILGTLPIRQREAVILRYWADMSDNQIAAVTGARQQAVTSNLERALAALAAGTTG